MRAQVVLIGAGVLVGAYGAWSLLARGFDNLVATVVWLAGGIVLHDFVLAPLLLLAAWLLVRPLHGRTRAVVTGALVVLGTVTVTAVPVLGRFGARADNPTLLPRDYGLGWLVLALVIAAVVAVVLGIGRLRGRSRSEVSSPEG